MTEERTTAVASGTKISIREHESYQMRDLHEDASFLGESESTLATESAQSSSQFNYKKNRANAVSKYSVVKKNVVVPRNIIINRSMEYAAHASSGATSSLFYSMGLVVPGQFSISGNEVVNVTEIRTREKKSMQQLNARLADYIEKVRFLEAQNKWLVEQLQKSRVTSTTTIESDNYYVLQNNQYKEEMNVVINENASLQVKIASLEEEKKDLEKELEICKQFNEKCCLQIEILNQKVIDLESEVIPLKKRLEIWTMEKDMDKQTITMLRGTVTNLRKNLDSITLKFVEAESLKLDIEQKLQTMKESYENQISELSVLAYRDTTTESKLYWTSEIGLALKEIQEMYDESVASIKNEYKLEYEHRIQVEIDALKKKESTYISEKNEIERLRTKFKSYEERIFKSEQENSLLKVELESYKNQKEGTQSSLKDEIEKYQKEISDLKIKIGFYVELLKSLPEFNHLDIEIEAYRKLLEIEEKRFDSKKFISGIIKETSETIRREGYSYSSLKTVENKALGPIGFYKYNDSDVCIILENSSQKTEHLGGWRLSKSVDGKETFTFLFPADFEVPACGQFKVWARGIKPFGSPATDLEANLYTTFGSGSRMTIKLMNVYGEERAYLTQTQNCD